VAIRGNDVGDVFTEYQNVTGTLAQNRLDYGVTFDPIVTSLPDDRSAMVTAAYRGPGGGSAADGGGRRARTGQRIAHLPPPTSNSQYITGIRLWENSLVPVSNEQEPSGNSPVTFHADNRLEQMVFDGYAGFSWIRGPRLNLAARFGVSHASCPTQERGPGQHAFVTQPAEAGATTTTDNHIVPSTAKARLTASLTGPMLALAGDSTVGRARIDGWSGTR
jgi:hypothetical protein